MRAIIPQHTIVLQGTSLQDTEMRDNKTLIMRVRKVGTRVRGTARHKSQELLPDARLMFLQVYKDLRAF